jgi:hypothetical protein
VQADVAAVTGDDAAMAVLGVGADLAALKELYAERVRFLEHDVLAPLDAANEAVARAEATLADLRRQQAATVSNLWHRYKPDYERYLHQSDEEPAAEAARSAVPVEAPETPSVRSATKWTDGSTASTERDAAPTAGGASSSEAVGGTDEQAPTDEGATP